MRAFVLVLVLLGVVYAGVQWVACEPTAAPPKTADGGARLGPYPLSQFYIEHDRFLAATDPRTVFAEEATWLQADDEVFGIVIEGQARAYPVPMISYHHVVNDVLRGIPVAITY
jgi:hypothetical protein